jgi:hypothetical protein
MSNEFTIFAFGRDGVSGGSVHEGSIWCNEFRRFTCGSEGVSGGSASEGSDGSIGKPFGDLGSTFMLKLGEGGLWNFLRVLQVVTGSGGGGGFRTFIGGGGGIPPFADQAIS